MQKLALFVLVAAVLAIVGMLGEYFFSGFPLIEAPFFMLKTFGLIICFCFVVVGVTFAALASFFVIFLVLQAGFWIAIGYFKRSE